MENTNTLFEKVTGISISDYAYDLPDEKIAKYPLDERDQSKLLVWKNGTIQDSHFSDLPDFLPANSLLVFNNTKVIRARLHFQKETGAKIEIFCLDPVDPIDYQIAFQTTQSCIWNCMIGNQKKWKGEPLYKTIQIDNTNIELCAEQIHPGDNKNLIRFRWNNPDFEFSRIIENAGSLPIPPYLNRETEQSDLERYQTVYSKIKGSVAAPTAGLHFTEKVFNHLTKNGHQLAELTLHVGAGTFQPVKSETISGHEMHSEHFYVTRDFLKKLIDHSGKKIAVGTTSVRTLESLYWLGFQAYKNPELSMGELKVTQWEAYQESVKISMHEALGVLIDFLDRHQTDYLSASTQIIIAPGYQFRVIDGLITNFHQPQSTLLLLISAYLGEEWRKIYTHALSNNYRFLSYGDSNLYLKE